MTLVPKVMFAFAWLLPACAPLASFRPANGLMDGRGFEAGLGVAEVGRRPYVEESGHRVGQAWLSGEPARWLSLSLVTAFDQTAMAFGGAARVDYLRIRRFAAGVEVEGGWGWAGASLPLAVRPLDPLWIYAAPRVGSWGLDPDYGALAGVDLQVVGGFKLRSEAQVSWQNLQYYNRRVHLGLALAYQW